MHGDNDGEAPQKGLRTAHAEVEALEKDMGSLDFFPVDPTALFALMALLVPCIKAGSLSGALWFLVNPGMIIMYA